MRSRISIRGCVGPSVRPSVHPSVHPSVRPSVRRSVGPLRLLIFGGFDMHRVASIGSCLLDDPLQMEK